MQLALAQVSTLNTPFEVDLREFAAAGCRQIELWFGKLDTYLDLHSIDATLRLLDKHQIDVPVASYQGGLLSGDATTDLARRQLTERLRLCSTLQIGTLVVAADLVGPVTQADVDRVTRVMAEVAQEAADHGIRLALEFQARATFCNNLQTALALVQQTANPHLGICLDMFHFVTGPSKLDDLNQLTGDTLFHVQLSDLAGRPRELATDADRILPGDGDLEYAPIIDRLRQIGYHGLLSVELMNPQIWQVPSRTVAEVAMGALRDVLGKGP
jgi:2-keto-myo-inositol isomerase